MKNFFAKIAEPTHPVWIIVGVAAIGLCYDVPLRAITKSFDTEWIPAIIGALGSGGGLSAFWLWVRKHKCPHCGKNPTEAVQPIAQQNNE